MNQKDIQSSCLAKRHIANIKEGLVVITGICGKISGNKLINIWVQMQQITPKHQPTVPFRKMYRTTKCHKKVYLQLF